MTAIDERVTAMVRGFEQERNDTLADSPELQRLVDLTPMEHRLLAFAAIRALRAASFEIIQNKNAKRL